MKEYLITNTKQSAIATIDPVAPDRTVVDKIVDGFLGSGELGLVLLFILIAGWAIDVKGAVMDFREGFKALGKLANAIEAISGDIEKLDKSSLRSHDELIDHIDRNTDKVLDKLEQIKNSQ